MIEDINQALEDYLQQWNQLCQDNEFLASMSANAVGWKVGDDAQYQQCYQLLRPDCDRIIETWMNGRWIAKMHLKSASLPGDITIIKLMQRRPGANDALELDHVDFQCKSIGRTESDLQATNLRWSWESNDIVKNYDWISLWFNDTEAKIKEYTVMDIVVQELQDLKV